MLPAFNEGNILNLAANVGSDYGLLVPDSPAKTLIGPNQTP